jgi:16S rRNA (guanine527-N7)-methyltransferase
METAKFDAEAFAQATDVSRETLTEVGRYRALLEDWSGRMNLVGPSALESFWLRHAYDSAQLLQAAPSPGDGPTPPLVWADIGAGAGFPGIILALLLKGRPGARVHLIESLTKRCRFLQAAVDALELPAQVHNARAESVKLTGIDIVTARACAPMDKLLEYAQPLMKAGARGLFLKGRDVESELSVARQKWKFDAVLIPSRSDPSGRIVSIERATRG